MGVVSISHAKEGKKGAFVLIGFKFASFSGWQIWDH
jgi:hypothetical protein